MKYNPDMNIVLVEPQIPQNTGNIARLCAATGSRLHLVGRLGFRTDDKHLKRAGLDYWKDLEILEFECFNDFELQNKPKGSFYFFSTKGKRAYSEVIFKKGDFLIFGSETCGLPDDLIQRYEDCLLRIPMVSTARSLNLANSASIVLYEALRQQGFPNCLPFP